MIGFIQQYGLYIGGAVALLVMAANALELPFSSKPKVRAKQLLTNAEREALNHIEAALPWCRIHAQVAMGAIVQPAGHLKGADFYRERGKFSQKIVDFVAEDRSTGEVVVLIELDDSSHRRDRDEKRDQITRTAGYKTIRLRLKWPTHRSVGNAIANAFKEFDQQTKK